MCPNDREGKDPPARRVTCKVADSYDPSSTPGPAPTGDDRFAATAARRRRYRNGAAVVWALLIAAWVWRLHATGTGPGASLQELIDHLKGAWWAIPAFIAIYALRALVLFPASLLTIAAGVLFGPVVGIGVAVVGANLSALVAFQIGKTFSPSSLRAADAAASGLLSRRSTRIRERSFTTVMVMRLAYLPFDLVNYAAGLLRIDLRAFLAATVIGSLPGTVSFVFAGASVHRLDAGLKGFDPRVFIASAVLFAASLAVAKVLQRRSAPSST